MKPLQFQYPFRSHQQLILERFEEERRITPSGEPLRFHVVAPPGAGKTIVGIELALRLGKPALVVCPNTAIQGQWAQKMEMFAGDNVLSEVTALVSTDAKNPRWLNVLTYQVLSIPEDPGEGIIEIAEGLWANGLLAEGNMDEEEVYARIQKMKTSNSAAYKREVAKYTKKLRSGKLDELLHSRANHDTGHIQSGIDNDNANTNRIPANRDITTTETNTVLSIFHPNTRSILLGLKQGGVKTIVFDECHHLQSWWAQVMIYLVKWMGIENIIGLTATPPIDENIDVLKNYMGLLGPIDFEIPTPAVVKDGMLAPYQDLLYMCRPLESEWTYLQNCHGKIRSLLVRFAKPDSHFCLFMQERFLVRKLADGSQREWKKLFTARKEYCIAGIKYLRSSGITIPHDIAITPSMSGHPTLEEWTILVEDYALNHLKLSDVSEYKVLYEEIRDALYTLGFILTEKGVKSYISPLDRVLAYSRGKLTAVRDILLAEMQTMGKDLRVAIVTDFEFSNALSLKQLDHVLDAECGGAISVMKMMVSHPELDQLNPVMITGKSLLCDDDIADEYQKRLLEWAQINKYDISVDLVPSSDGTYVSIEGHGKDWNTRSAILFTTSLLEEGFTRCMIGTRGLLGEGWDSIALNTLIDLSVAATYASVNQLRGRSIRKNSDVPRKIANNWDVVCYVPELEKGVNDAIRLSKKHNQFYGICSDGRISKGITHLDARLSMNERLKTEETNIINEAMLRRSAMREPIYDLWRVGEPFDNLEQNCLELNFENEAPMPYLGKQNSSLSGLKMKTNGLTFTGGVGMLSLLAAAIATGISLPVAVGAGAASAIFLYFGAKGIGKTADFGRQKVMGNRPEAFLKEISLAVFYSLKEIGIMSADRKEKNLSITTSSEGALRVFLDGSAEESATFSKCMDEILSPLADSRYAVPRYQSIVKDTKNNIAYLRQLLSPGEPVLAGYHPVPQELGLNKERAAVFQKYWNQFVSRGDIVYLRSVEGENVLNEYGLVNHLGLQKHVAAIWR